MTYIVIQIYMCMYINTRLCDFLSTFTIVYMKMELIFLAVCINSGMAFGMINTVH